tara:strand:+ start:901 stop:1125 length:225 start_codon:yes stop_codon:yes gene_type:complete
MSKGQASKSASGASMSKYDVEVEARLTKLEAAVKALESNSNQEPSVSGDFESKFEKLVTILKKTPSLGMDQYDN